jgi:hypothetical protein
MNSPSHILSPLKWTKTLTQSSSDDFIYEAAILIVDGLLRQMQDISLWDKGDNKIQNKYSPLSPLLLVTGH